MNTNAWQEGSQLDPARYPIAAGAKQYRVDDLTLAVAVEGLEEILPTLARAAQRTVPCRNTKITWRDRRGTWRNFTQIFRSPWQTSDGREHDRPQAEQLLEHLRDIETTLRYGRASKAISPTFLHTCGGYLNYLEREIADDDVLTLRPLAGRELLYRTWVSDDPEAPRTCEWLSELSLEVRSGP
jgi:hypothetical protein